MRYRVPPPTFTPSRFGLLAAAQVVDDDGNRWMNGVEFDREPCSIPESWPGPCAPVDADAEKTASSTYGNETGGDPFTVYHMEECRAPGGAYQAASARAVTALQRGESIAVEDAFADYLAGLPEGAAEDVTPTAGAVSPKVALAVLEQEAGARYGGVPTFHVSRGIASLFASDGLLERSGTHLETKLGSLVSAGAGYAAMPGPRVDADTPGTPAPDGETWMWATGPVVLRRSAVLTPDEPAFDPKTNTHLALAERVYVPTIETCVLLAVRVARGW